MAIIPICPHCGTPAIPVPKGVVASFICKTMPAGEQFSACPAASCTVAYFSSEDTIKTGDLKIKLWYKDAGDDVPVCYCSGISRGEIRKAVREGADSIDAVQQYLKKDRTGFCKTENPLSGCCRNAFLYEIERALQQL